SRGSFLATFEDTNSATATASLSDAQVQSYLSGLISAKKVPAPDNDTLYMIYFPSVVSITLDPGVVSCQQFCAYHSSYTVGNQLGCVASNPMYTVNDFSVAVAATAVHVPAGGSAMTGVTLTKTTGVADNATLTAVGLPTGLVAAFAPPSVTSAGGTSMVTFTAASTLAVGTSQKVTIKATGTNVSPSVDVTVDIVAPP